MDGDAYRKASKKKRFWLPRDIPAAGMARLADWRTSFESLSLNYRLTVRWNRQPVIFSANSSAG